MIPKHRLALLLASSVSLAACGGGNAQSGPAVSLAEVAIGGTVTGLPTGRTLILTNGSAEATAIQSSGSYLFSKKLSAGSDYNVSIFGYSSGLACTLSNGTGKANANAGTISDINVTCVPGAIALANFYVGVTVSGLVPGNSVTLTNNGRDTLTVSDNGFFIFRNYYVKEALYSGQAGGYRVAVQVDPPGQTCTVSNASGALTLDQPTDFVNILAVCK